MSQRVQAHGSPGDSGEADTARAADRRGDGARPLVGGPALALMSLQRAAGNAAVVRLVQAQRQARTSAAPGISGGDESGLLSVSRDAEEEAPTAASEETAESGASAAAAAGSAGDGQPSEAEQGEKKAEAEEESEAEPMVPAGGGPAPVAGEARPAGGAGPAADPGAAGGDGFVEGGRRGSVPFHDAVLDHFDPDRDTEPHAFTGDGRTGTNPWAGGGGAGPKGNQPSGSVTNQVPPTYDSRGVGLFSKSEAWVKEGTGVADVTRSFASTDAGDQGNSWYVTEQAAAALTAHEQRHVSASKNDYDSKIQPALDRVARSATIGKGVFYKQSDARAWVQKQVGWAGAIKEFEEADQGDNAPGGVVDTMDYGGPSYPRQIGAGSVAGKDYQNRLVMNSEPDPK